MTIDFKIGDQVKLNDKYYREGGLYFGRDLRYKNNFLKEIINISAEMTDGNGDQLPRVITLAGADKMGYPLQFAETLLTLIN
jgi:hypothetical protein